MHDIFAVRCLCVWPQFVLNVNRESSDTKLSGLMKAFDGFLVSDLMIAVVVFAMCVYRYVALLHNAQDHMKHRYSFISRFNVASAFVSEVNKSASCILLQTIYRLL
jgi:hypothetical protein